MRHSLSEDPVVQRKRVLGWLVHVYTALGIPLNLYSLVALLKGNGSLFFALNFSAVFIDSTDGFMARYLNIKELVPSFDGAKLDDLIDFLTFTFLPLIALPLLNLISHDAWWTLLFPMMSSAYGFCQTRAKTDDAFVGFPSYWNIFALYFFILQPPEWVIIVILHILGILVFIPIHYVYPTKTKRLFKTTMLFGTLYMFSLGFIALNPNASWTIPLTYCSLLYMAYYIILSLIHDREVRQRLKQ